MFLLSMMLVVATLPGAPVSASEPARVALSSDCITADLPCDCPGDMTMAGGGCDRCCIATLPSLAAIDGPIAVVRLERVAWARPMIARTLMPETPPPRSA